MVEKNNETGGIVLHVDDEKIRIIFEHLNERLEKIVFDLKQPNGIPDDRYVKELQDIFYLLETMKKSLSWN